MTPKERAESYARAFPKYPRLRYDERWLDGFWVLGQDYRGNGLHGSYPPGFLKRLQAIFPEEFQGRVLHLFSGELPKSVGGIRVDISQKRFPAPDVFGDAHQLPFPDETFDLIVADPPYTPADAKKYGTKMINRRAVMAEAARILRPGGHLIWLDTRSPMFRKIVWHWWGVIGLARSTNHVYRAVTFYQRRKSAMSKLRVKLDEASRMLAAAMAILLGEDAVTVAEAMKEQKANTKVRETGSDDDEDEAPTKKRGRGRPPKAAKPEAEETDDEDDDEEEEKPKAGKLKAPKPDADDDDDDADSEGVAIPKDKVLEGMERSALKKLALDNDIDAAGKTREDLVALLTEARDGSKKKKGKPAAAETEDDEDDDAEEAPAKKKKPAAAEEDDDDAEEKEEIEYPKVSVMKKDLEAFFKVNKQLLTDMGFFGGKPKKGSKPAQNTYDEVMGDTGLIKEAWKDNIHELGVKGLKKLHAQAAEIEDDDDDDDE